MVRFLARLAGLFRLIAREGMVGIVVLGLSFMSFSAAVFPFNSIFPIPSRAQRALSYPKRS
jgi:hypothetical protein